MFNALADLAHRRPRRVVAIAVLAAVAAGVLGSSVADRLTPFIADDPASESIRAADRLERLTGVDPDVGLIALVRTGAPVRSSAAARARVERVAREIGRDPAVGRAVSYYDSRDPAMVSSDGRSTYVVASFKAALEEKRQQDAAERLTGRLRLEGVTLGGRSVAEKQVNETVERDLRRAEMLAFPLLFLLSLWFFRSGVAALLPPLVGGLSILGTLLFLRIASELGSISIFALNLVTGMGLGLAIDYSLFIVSRYREEIARSGPGQEALRRTLATAGRTVLFSSLTVAAAMAALAVFPQQFLYSMAVGGTFVALLACAVALVVLPAILALLGGRVNSLAPPRLQRAAERDARPEAAGAWYRISRFVMRRPGRVAAASAALLIALGIPFLGIKFTSVDPSILPQSAGSRQVHESLARDFPPNRTAPITLAIEAPPGRAVDAFADRLRRTPGVLAVRPARPVGRRTSLVEVVPASGGLAEATQDLVHRIRALPAPFEVGVSGQTAYFADQKASLGSHLPAAFAIIVAATILVLFLMTGSVVLPLKALLMNVLTLSAAFGILVLIFQDGRLEGLLAYTSQGALESTQPILLFAITFGLSTDYGVFLLSRIKEARDAGASDSESVAIGLERTGRIVTAAAALFCVAIGAIATSQIIFIKELGLGTALAVLIDATLVRALLVPALMELLGRRNWWAPAPLRRIHRRIGLSEA